RTLDGVDRVAGHVRDDLLREAARVAADDGLALPHRLRRAELEPGAHRLLEHDRGGALERVDLSMRLGRELAHDDVAIFLRGLPQMGHELESLRLAAGR